MIAQIVKWLIKNTTQGPLVFVEFITQAGESRDLKVQPKRLLDNTKHQALLSPDLEHIQRRPQTLTDMTDVSHV